MWSPRSLLKRGTDHSVPTRNPPISRRAAAVDRAVCPPFQQAPSPALRWIVFSAVAALLVFQLFVPPIIGLSDQGDFGRMIGRFGYGPAVRSMPLSAGFV